MVIVGECQSNIFPFYILLNEIFSTEDDTNKETSAMIGGMAVGAAKALLSEIRDEKKAMSEHLSSVGVRFCWNNTSDADHAAGLFKMSVNDPSERSSRCNYRPASILW